MVIIVVRKVESAVVIVVIHIFIDYNHGFPSVEERVGDDGSKRRAADHEATVDVAAIDAVVEVIGSTVVVNGSDVVRNMHIAVVVVMIRVYVGGVGNSVSGVRAVTFGMTSRGGLVVTGIVAASVVVTAIAGTADRLRLCLTLCSVATFCFSSGGVGRRSDSVGVWLDRSVVRISCSVGVHILSCCCIRCRTCSCRTSGSSGVSGLVGCRGTHRTAGR